MQIWTIVTLHQNGICFVKTFRDENKLQRFVHLGHVLIEESLNYFVFTQEI